MFIYVVAAFGLVDCLLFFFYFLRDTLIAPLGLGKKPGGPLVVW